MLVAYWAIVCFGQFKKYISCPNFWATFSTAKHVLILTEHALLDFILGIF
jgi:hypothetical protein